ncbi:MAG: hypothetical protein HYY32_07440 [Chloroflexi bacterium]|nr:hypothetical protein [Chloroflexota bacterium]
MMMTHKQRILAASRKQPVDKLPFGARIDLWYNYNKVHGTLPEKYRGLDMVDILRDLGAGIRQRHEYIWKETFRNVEIVDSDAPPYRTTEYRTPKGNVTRKVVFTQEEGTVAAYETEHMFKSAEDYAPIEYLIENTVLTIDQDKYLKAVQRVGEDGLVHVRASQSPMQEVMRKFMGFERFFFELADHRSQVEHLYEVTKELVWKKLKILAESPTEHVQVDGNWSDDIHTPVFRKYFVPYFREAVDYVHSKGKVTMVHMDGEVRRLIPMFLETGIDMAEAFCPAPMTSVTTADLRKAWGDRVVVWGGMPAILFEPQYSDEEFDAYVRKLFKEIAPGNAFIVGMGDNVPFDGNIERVGRIVELIDECGQLPIKA